MQNAIALREASRLLAWITTQQSVDLVLLDRIADGDKLAMQALYGRHNLCVYRIALRLLDNEALAEDVLISVFVDVWRNAKRFEGNSQVSTWIMSIARVKALFSLCRPKNESFDECAAATIGGGLES
jgi:RNA polymerase sigma-70 factor, ECF subfamily